MGYRAISQIVDTHAHVWPPEDDSSRSRATWTDLVSSLGLGETLDRLVVVTPGEPPGDDGWMLDRAAEHGRLVRVVVRAEALATLGEHPHRDLGIGVRVRIGGGQRAVVDETVAQAASAGIAVCVQNPVHDWAPVSRWASRFPDTTFLIDHLGHPDVSNGTGVRGWRAFLRLNAFPNVSIKFPNIPYFAEGLRSYERLAPHVIAAFEAFGGGRILWASDWPNANAEYTSLLDAASQLIDAADSNAIDDVFANNSLRLFWNDHA